jgi:isoleucyl-tRNA synthetase
VNWCIDCGSALAEAEVEYEDKTSPAIDVAFEAVDAAGGRARVRARQGAREGRGRDLDHDAVDAAGNQAIAAHPEFDYELVDTERGALILVVQLRDACLKRYGLEARAVLGSAKGAASGACASAIPLKTEPSHDPRRARDSGRGNGPRAHRARARRRRLHHGCREQAAPRPTRGRRRALQVERAALRRDGGAPGREAHHRAPREEWALLRNEPYRHSYPHCWRHKTPIIFRATTQWFIGMDTAAKSGKTLRETARQAIADTTFYPAWGRARIAAMIDGRPDWTLSRQRYWGTPLPFFLHRETEELHPDTEALLLKAADKVEAGGIEAWFAASAEDFGVDSKAYRKLTDTVDVWFDSGTTHFSVLRGLAGQRWPADIYLEGSDQHRGWFQSSLLTGCAMDGRAPYDALLTHGFTVDAQGRKMSKSLGNTYPSAEVSDTLGAEIIRLWVALTDYSGELSLSDEILKRVVESYRRIRNTLRFLLANTADFDPKKDRFPFPSGSRSTVTRSR